MRQSHVDGNGASVGGEFVTRVSPAGDHGETVRLPEELQRVDVGLDRRGRALLVGWHGDDLTGRWSRPHGPWEEPFVLAGDIPNASVADWGMTPQVELNRRGDAVVGWGVTGRVPQAWGRYKPAGAGWTPAVRLTDRTDPPEVFRTAIGDCGHVAFVWTPRDGARRQLRVLRASPGVSGS